MQNELKQGPLLDENGNLSEAGFAYQLVKKYNRKAIKASKLRIKEWDYYYIGNNDFGIALTIADNSYMSLMSVSVLNFKENYQCTKSYMNWFTLGKVNLPATSEIGDVSYKKNNFHMSFQNNGNERKLVCFMSNVVKNKNFICDITLTPTNENSMVIATPFNKQKHFYYNQKINLLKATGTAYLGEKFFDLNGCYGVLDWGRGVWTYNNTWYWSSMSGEYNGKRIGFNLGYGFGDTSKASENMFFYNDEAFKLEDVEFIIPKNEQGKDDYLSEWKIVSQDKKINLSFKPLMDRYAKTSALVIMSLQHQVFGKFSGYIIVNNKKVEFMDMVGFAEKVTNRW